MRYVPGGTTTSPPPPAEQAAKAFSKAAVSLAFPSPAAPWSRTLTRAGAVAGRLAAGAATARAHGAAQHATTSSKTAGEEIPRAGVGGPGVVVCLMAPSIPVGR